MVQYLLFFACFLDVEAGHGGASGRFKALKDRAREYAFLFAPEGIMK